MSLPQITILSLGDMGTGIATLLTAHNYPISTSLTGRSSHTAIRAKNAGVTAIDNDKDLILTSDIVISIVPPRDAVETALRVRKAWIDAGAQQARNGAGKGKLWYVDLNAVSPARAREVGRALGVQGERLQRKYFGIGAQGQESGESGGNPTEQEEDIIFLDGGIIGGPPSRKDETGEWSTPSIPTSGPHVLATFPSHGEELCKILSLRHISPLIGPATGLKMCFASLSKGFAALALQSFASAQAMGVLEELQKELGERVPAVKTRAENAITSCPPKAYRWVAEMKEIGECFGTDGGWTNGDKGDQYANVFGRIAEVYEVMAGKTILGEERIGQRNRGTTPEDVAGILVQALLGGK